MFFWGEGWIFSSSCDPFMEERWFCCNFSPHTCCTHLSFSAAYVFEYLILGVIEAYYVCSCTSRRCLIVMEHCICVYSIGVFFIESSSLFFSHSLEDELLSDC